MVLNNFDNEKLFAKSVPVSLKDVYTNQTRTVHLFLTMEWQEASAGMYSRKVLAITLTDNNDPFFLYNLHISEEDFQMLKSSQELLINFSSFPQHIIGYIEKCLQEEKNPQPKFLLIFTINERLGNVASPSQLDIIETNQFKNLTHLFLKFVAASETAVKQYIASCFKMLKEENKQLQSNLAFSEQDKIDKLTSKEHALSSKEKELELLRKQCNSELAMKDSQHAQELREERNRLLDKLKEEENRYERERNDKDQQFRREIQQLEYRVNTLDALNKELHEKNHKHESTIQKLKTNELSLEDEIRKLKNNIHSYKMKYENLQSESKDKQSRIKHQDEIIYDLRNEIEKQVSTIQHLKEQIELETRKRKSLEEEFDNVKVQFQMSEKTRLVLDKDKDDLNEIIMDLQEKAKKSKSKIELAAKYKQTIEEKDKLLEGVKREKANLICELEVKDTEIKSLTGSVHVLQGKIDDLNKEVEEKIRLLKWMHRQLTDNNIFPQYNPHQTSLVTSPSNIAQKQLAKISSNGQNSRSPENLSSFTTSNKPTSKSVRRETPSPASRKYSSAPHRFHDTDGADSAYGASPFGYTNQATPENVQMFQNMNFDQEFETDQAFNAAFGEGDYVLKQSTAKKPTKPVKSSIPKKKR